MKLAPQGQVLLANVWDNLRRMADKFSLKAFWNILRPNQAIRHGSYLANTVAALLGIPTHVASAVWKKLEANRWVPSHPINRPKRKSQKVAPADDPSAEDPSLPAFRVLALEAIAHAYEGHTYESFLRSTTRMVAAGVDIGD